MSYAKQRKPCRTIVPPNDRRISTCIIRDGESSISAEYYDIQ